MQTPGHTNESTSSVLDDVAWSQRDASALDRLTPLLPLQSNRAAELCEVEGLAPRRSRPCTSRPHRAITIPRLTWI
jgi:hypothetical protein